MVVKQKWDDFNDEDGFEDGVILYGSQASTTCIKDPSSFEDGVILYGSQALIYLICLSR